MRRPTVVSLPLQQGFPVFWVEWQKELFVFFVFILARFFSPATDNLIKLFYL
jgi:hypothetical protein